MQLGKVDVDLLVHGRVYAVSDVLLTNFVVLIVVVAVKCGLVLVDSFVNDVAEVQRFYVALNDDRGVVRGNGEFNGRVCWVLV